MELSTCFLPSPRFMLLTGVSFTLHVDVHLAVSLRQWELPRRDALPAGTGYESRPHIPFEGSSTARSDYTPKAIDRSAFPAAPAGYGYQPSSIPFAGESESQAAYQYVPVRSLPLS